MTGGSSGRPPAGKVGVGGRIRRWFARPRRAATQPARVPTPAPPRQVVARLQRLLDRHPSARRVLVHLACVEQVLLMRADPQVLPQRVLAAALAQLERLAAGEADPEIAALKATLADAGGVPVLPLADAWEPPDVMSRFAESRLGTAEATLSTFESGDAGFEPRRR
jgi:hypothetical protein